MKANSRRNLRNKKCLQLALTIAGVVVFFSFIAPLAWRAAVAIIIEPVVFTKSWLQHSQHAVPVYLRDRATLQNELETLRQQVAELHARPEATAYLEAKNEAFGTFFDQSTEDRIVAGVLLDARTTPHETMVIDKGSADGVVVDAPVYVDAEHVIGLVSAVSTHQSVVQLLTTAGFESTVYIFGPDIYTTARGLGGGVMQVGVPQGIVLETDDLVVTPSVAGGSIGTIAYIDSTPSQPEQYGYVIGPVALHEIFMVTVGRTALVPQSFAEAQTAVADARERITTVPVPDGVLVDVIDSVSSSSTATSTDTEIELE